MYKMITTMYDVFTLSNMCGQFDIIRTYKNLLLEVLNDYVLFTELVIVLNWQMFNTNEKPLKALYGVLCKEATKFYKKRFEDDEKALDYFKK